MRGSAVVSAAACGGVPGGWCWAGVVVFLVWGRREQRRISIRVRDEEEERHRPAEAHSDEMFSAMAFSQFLQLYTILFTPLHARTARKHMIFNLNPGQDDMKEDCNS